MRHVVFCDLSGCNMFFGIISKMARFSEEKLLNIKCMFGFSLQFLSETLLILSSIQRHVVINVKTSSCKVPVILARF
jgi:hypothetical protein